MSNDTSIFYEGRSEDLRRNGYIESASEPDFFAALLEAVKRKNPKAECVTNVGQGSIHQIIFLPNRRKEIVRRLKSELSEYESDAASTRKALAQLSNARVSDSPGQD